MSNSEIYLRAMMSLIARQTFSTERLKALVSPRGTPKLIEAFNLCDGTNKQTEITTKLGIDPGQFSRTVKQWVDDGIVIRVGEGKDSKLVHVYPLPDKFMKTNDKDRKPADE
jgi:DNA-binding MarR family transcriptional regulator